MKSLTVHDSAHICDWRLWTCISCLTEEFDMFTFSVCCLFLLLDSSRFFSLTRPVAGMSATRALDLMDLPAHSFLWPLSTQVHTRTHTHTHTPTHTHSFSFIQASPSINISSLSSALFLLVPYLKVFSQKQSLSQSFWNLHTQEHFHCNCTIILGWIY